MKRKKCVAMLLAGGQGSRLGLLTKNIAKPAVSFGGKYRIIDFSLSNCVNSGIDTVGILIQYRPLVLNKYVSTGEAWDMDVAEGGVYILPPYASQSGGEWYEGTADAIYHNIDFIDMYDPDNVLILSGDHIYKMDYAAMQKYHEDTESDLTVSVIEVPMEEASRFGIMSVDENDTITKFTEKPAEPDSNLASMGVYIFSWKVLRKALLDDHEDKESDHDFGKNIIPKLLGEGKKLSAYRFKGYWRDVGTISSYYDSQMEMMEETDLNIFSDDMKIYSNNNTHMPLVIGPEGSIQESLISNGCDINGTIKCSIVGSGAEIGEDTVIERSIVLPDAHIGKGCKIVNAIINEGVDVPDGEVIGDADGETIVYGEACLSI